MKKSFSVIAVVLFISTSLNAKSEINSDPFTCWDVADETVEAFQTSMLKLKKIATPEQEYNVWEASYDACMGN